MKVLKCIYYRKGTLNKAYSPSISPVLLSSSLTVESRLELKVH